MLGQKKNKEKFAGLKNSRTFAAVLEHILNNLFSEILKTSPL